jgi:hypothetical protein
MAVIFTLVEQLANRMNISFPFSAETSDDRLLVKTHGYLNPAAGRTIINKIGFVPTETVSIFNNNGIGVVTAVLSSITHTVSAIGLKVYHGTNTAIPGVDFDLGVNGNSTADEIELDVYRELGGGIVSPQFVSVNINIYPSFDSSKNLILYVHKGTANIDHADDKSCILVIRKMELVPVNSYTNTYLREKIITTRKQHLLNSFVDEKFNDNESEYWCNDNINTIVTAQSSNSNLGI